MAAEFTETGRDVSGAREHVVEHDQPADPLGSAARSYHTLHTTRF